MFREQRLTMDDITEVSSSNSIRSIAYVPAVILAVVTVVFAYWLVTTPRESWQTPAQQLSTQISNAQREANARIFSCYATRENLLEVVEAGRQLATKYHLVKFDQHYTGDIHLQFFDANNKDKRLLTQLQEFNKQFARCEPDYARLDHAQNVQKSIENSGTTIGDGIIFIPQ